MDILVDLARKRLDLESSMGVGAGIAAGLWVGRQAFDMAPVPAQHSRTVLEGD
jgi:hypothetical protein